MAYRFIYDDQYFRTIPSVMIDARVGTPLAGATGAAMETYIQPQVAMIVPGVLPYKMETQNGNLVSVLALQASISGAGVLFLIVRPAFQYDLTEIQLEITNFISGKNWVYDL